MPKWYDLARAEVGVKEAPGAADNPVVVKYYADAGFSGVKHDSVAWCAAFANAMLERAQVRGSGSLAARSFMKWGIGLDRPVTGCIVVFRRGNSTWQGHVAFFVSETSSHVQVLGGNQGDAVNIRSFSKHNLLGYRWPSNVPVESASPKSESRPALLMDGSTGWRVKALQERLEALGYHVVPDGHFGPETARAVVSFQLDAGIAKDGVVGPETQAALDSAKPVRRTAREEEGVAELKGTSRIVKKGSSVQTIAGVTAILGGGSKAVQESGLLDGAQNLVDKGNQVRGVIGSASEFLGWAWQHWWILIPIIAGIVWWQSRGIVKARVEDHQSGKTV